MTAQKLTITEALQELRTIEKRIGSKQNNVLSFLWRQNTLRDPHESNGGSAAYVASEIQAIDDLSQRTVAIRTAINKVNMETEVTILGQTKTIAEWLIWKREVAPRISALYGAMQARLQEARGDARRKGLNFTAVAPADVTLDVVVNVNEAQLSKSIDEHEQLVGALDGILSLKNATVTIEV